MRAKSYVLIATHLIIALLWPTGVFAKRVSAGGSLTITNNAGPLTTQLVAMVLTANPGLEKVITQQLPLPGPLFVAPFFVNQDKDNPQQGDLNTHLVLTNTTGSPLSLTLTLRALDGSLITTANPNLGAFETKAVILSDVLP